MTVRRAWAFFRDLFLAKQKLAKVLLSTRSFEFLQKHGVHVTPVHFYSPVPDNRELVGNNRLWSEPRACPGIDFRTDAQLGLLSTFAHYAASECGYPRDFYNGFNPSNIYFGFVSAVAMHSFIREKKPRRFVEVGLGNSSLVIGNALALNSHEGIECQYVGIDPYPSKLIQKTTYPVRIRAERVETTPVDEFLALGENDILSIDTTHVIRTGGDVVFLYLDILPLLANGVLIHVHDIFLPFEYPKQWMVNRYFWNEQYLLHALLVDSSSFTIIWAQRYIEQLYPDEYRKAFARVSFEENHESYSFWFQRASLPLASEVTTQ